MVFLAERLREDAAMRVEPLVLMGSEMPVSVPRSALDDPGARHARWRHRLHAAARRMGRPEPARQPRWLRRLLRRLRDGSRRAWLGSLDSAALDEVEMFACGPTADAEGRGGSRAPLQRACQVSLEEFMACAVGGCAGCAVKVETPSGAGMKRVCVDGPVFDANAVFAE